MQLIDGKTCELSSFSEFEDILGENKNGQDVLSDSYVLVAIIGAQCSGKSTFLNAVFGSDFPTLPPQLYGENIEPTDGNRLGQVQTTRGTWISPVHLQLECKAPLYLLLDNEGCDGQERFGDALFERKSTLFSLALADILIINMWTSDVGRFAASNLSLLQTIIEIYFPHFRTRQSQRLPFKRPVLMFILRDHTSGALFQHCENIRQGLQRVLEDALIDSLDHEAPNANADSIKLDEAFDIRVYSFPHYVLQREEFDKKIESIRSVFNPSSEYFVLNKQCCEDSGKIPLNDLENRLKNFPLNELYSYMKTCWELISHCTELDLPTRKQITAEIRCEAFMRKIIKPAIESKRKEWLQSLGEGRPIQSIEKEIQFLCTQNGDLFQQYTSHYPDSVTKKYLEEIEEQTPRELRHALFTPMVELLTADIIIEIRVSLKTIVENAMRKSTHGWEQLREQVQNLEHQLIQPFLNEQVASGFIEQKDEHQTKASCLESLHSIIEKKCESTICTEIQLQLITLSKIDELPTFMIQLFMEAYEPKVSETKLVEKHYTQKDHTLLDSQLIDIAKTFVHVGVDYLNNVYFNRYASVHLPEEDRVYHIHYEVDFELTSPKTGQICERSLAFKLFNVSIGKVRSGKQKCQIQHNGTDKLIETSSDRTLDKSSVIIRPSDVKQILRLYFQGVSHAIEVQREKARHSIQQAELLKSQKRTFAFLWEIPLWFWLVVFFFVMEGFVELLTSSAFWILLLIGCYFYLIPLRSSQGLPLIKSLYSKASLF
ncbi:GTP-binding protein sey1 [Perkinsela sp. CCAP 1560/4]|nr:GTP-binding protein sey1 [Perkinsela sp. CCAP 1560/4]|eukprot:KNH08731.1 GTP-binding protein sey1 [Perkinsela sp. CCAP 1560/4]